MGWSQDLFRALSRSLSREVKEHVGTDQFGNKYYYIPPYKNWRGVCEISSCPTSLSTLGQTIREKRIVEAANKKEVDYEIGDIPTEWEAWIRRTRKTPPTMEEIVKNENYREEVKIKSQDFCEKEKLLSKETSEELLPPPVQTQIKGHASAPYFGKEEPSVAPSSTGKTFQPGSWMPQDGKSHSQ
ncbi:NADH dehydrogenase [ubiquinone] 1 alpha subcomplex assembly factor 2 isoform X2 [Piliocolobus tephrosceles]|uniref:NADH dehydrogenase [ubiquinone] 1 alpha subcomplex assembly factor 2 isoform X2 n=1 Tax=Piliocolobus tephrosceles TaxID=591936 RepID=UPI000C2A587C|nr:NADH dehydrogenase [ubiquinone] 1 alpha subcomplex assembly factor 2 isoform X2 [Piliocolobus tephrosceles]